MAKKKTVKTVKVSAPVHTCAECAHHFDEHEIGADGKPFLCHCELTEYYRKFSRFLDEAACDQFKQIWTGERSTE